MKKQRFITNHDENFKIAIFLGIIAVIVFAFYTVKGLFIGDTIIGGFIKSWTSGYGIVILIFIVINALVFFIDWLAFFCVKKIVIRKGNKHNGIVASEIEVRHTHKGAVRRDWKYVIELEDFSKYISTAYTTQIPLRTKCTVYILKSICIITDFDV